ncbi:MAG TPA: iron-sulfur cluster-binding domain-containing protein, partial [Mycobacterium sp.]|nr:iron-sulfur cluster-binding domain-containing protein [Mycobacterium sp.]
CGPAPYMAVVTKALSEAGVPRERVHVEVFESLSGDPFSTAPTDAIADDGPDAAEAQIELDGQAYTLRWPRSRNLVDTMLAAGIDVPYSCREGNCGSCAATVLEGEVQMAESKLLEAQDVADGLFLACQARPVTDAVKIEF